MRWLSASALLLGVGLLVGCGDDDDTVPVRVLDAGTESGADAGVDSGRTSDRDPEIIPKPNPNWHIEHPPDSDRTWMVSPDGARTFVVGVDSVFSEDHCDGIGNYIRRAPDAAATEWKRLTDTFHFNAVGAFGNLEIENAPYSLVVEPEPRGDDRALKNASGQVLRNGLGGVKIGDPYNPAFKQDLRDLLAGVQSRGADRRLQIVYLGNESGVFDIANAAGGLRDFRNWIWSSCPATSTLQAPLCAPHALQQSLHSTYPSIGQLNTAWGSTYGTFEAINAPPSTCNATCKADFLRFVREDLLPTWVNDVVTFARSYLPKHVIATPRLALASSKQFHFYSAADTWADDGTSIGAFDPYPLLSKFDLIALNVYSASPTFEEPWFSDGIHRLQAESQLPAIVSEFGTRATISGWTNQSGAPGTKLPLPLVATQADRADRYASQFAQLSAFPDIVGVVYSRWADEFVASDPLHQSNRGLVQCSADAATSTAGISGEPWTDFVNRVSFVNLSATNL